FFAVLAFLAVLFFAAEDFFAAVFLAVVFLAGDFFAAVFLAGAFVAVDFLAGDFCAAVFVAGDFFAADFFAAATCLPPGSRGRRVSDPYSGGRPRSPSVRMILATLRRHVNEIRKVAWRVAVASWMALG